MGEHVLHDIEGYRAALVCCPRVLLFKHSPTCPISAAAHREYEAFAREHRDFPTLFVDVIADRATARAIAELCGVRHESPQAILFEKGIAVWHTSHHGITAAALAAAVAPRC